MCRSRRPMLLKRKPCPDLLEDDASLRVTSPRSPPGCPTLQLPARAAGGRVRLNFVRESCFEVWGYVPHEGEFDGIDPKLLRCYFYLEEFRIALTTPFISKKDFKN